MSAFARRRRQLDRLLRQIERLREAGEYSKAVAPARRALRLTGQIYGARHPRYIAMLNNSGMLSFWAGDPDTAGDQLLQAIQLGREVLGANHPDRAAPLKNLADVGLARGRLAAAEPLLVEALGIERLRPAENDLHLVDDLTSLGQVYDAMGRYAAAARAYEEALSAIDQSQTHHPDITGILNNLAVLRLEMDRPGEAKELLNRAVEIQRAEAGEHHPDFATGLHNLAGAYLETGEYARAEELYQRALEITRAALGEEHPETASSINALATLYETMGQHSRAESGYLEALRIRRHALGDRHPDVARTLSNLAQVNHSAGNIRGEQEYLSEALAIYREQWGDRHPDVGDVLNSLATLHLRIGDYPNAEKLFRRAEDSLGESLGRDSPGFGRILDNRAVLYLNAEKYDAAEPLLKTALAIFRQSPEPNASDLAACLNNLAALYHHGKHDLLQAGELYREAMDIRVAAARGYQPEIASSLMNLGVIRESLGDKAAAEANYLKALAYARETAGERHPQAANAAFLLGTLYVASGRPIEGKALIMEAVRIDDELIATVFSFTSERQRLAYLTTVRHREHAALSLAITRRSSAETVRDALDLVLRRKGIVAHGLSVHREAVLTGRHPALAGKMHQLAMLQQQIAHRRLTGPGGEGQEAHRKLLAEWDGARDELERELAREVPVLDLERRLNEADRIAIAAALPKDAALIEFIRIRVYNFSAVRARGDEQWTGSRYLAFVMAASAPEHPRLIDLGEATEIERLVANFRAVSAGASRNLAAKSDADPAAMSTNGFDLRQAVFDPVTADLGQCRNLFIAADGALSSLPFGALPAGEGQHLIDSYQLTYLNTGRDLLRPGSRTVVAQAVPVVAADPDFELAIDDNNGPHERGISVGRVSRGLEERNLRFDRLPGTRSEGLAVAAMLGVSPMLEDRVLEKDLKSCHSPKILHIATHGFFLSDANGGAPRLPVDEALMQNNRWTELRGLENPLLRAGLALAGANTWLSRRSLASAAEDGLLTAEDVLGMDLADTELVVLSACDTGLGEVHPGEGVFGLSRAFILAGARSLVLSLWKVPDQQTHELMTEFYRHLLDGEPCSTALRAAQLAIKARYSNPFYWGAFVLHGAPGPLSGSRSGYGQPV